MFQKFCRSPNIYQKKHKFFHLPVFSWPGFKVGSGSGQNPFLIHNTASTTKSTSHKYLHLHNFSKKKNEKEVTKQLK